jgi:ankyrin repeat protein
MQSENESKWAVVLGSPREGAACCELLQSGFDPNSRLGHEKTTPLMQAAGRGQMHACRTLIAAGADVKAGDINNRTALHFAAANGHDEVCKLLLAHGASVDVMTTTDGGTPLHWAAGRPAAAKLLIEAGASVHARTKWEVTPLQEAVDSNDEEVCRIMLAAGADPMSESIGAYGNYLTPLESAVSKGNGVLARLLSEGREIDFFKPSAAGTALIDLVNDSADTELVTFFKELHAKRTERQIREGLDEGSQGHEERAVPRASFSPI